MVGAGPAGLAAAGEAAAHGLSVVVLDDNARPGGQYFRQLPETFRRTTPSPFEKDRKRADALFRVLDHPGVSYVPNAVVWDAPEPLTLAYAAAANSGACGPGASSSRPGPMTGRCRSPAGRCPASLPPEACRTSSRASAWCRGRGRRWSATGRFCSWSRRAWRARGCGSKRWPRRPGSPAGLGAGRPARGRAVDPAARGLVPGHPAPGARAIPHGRDGSRG